ncbi:hypothetical protein, partial [Gluconacetobacter diazotrophicus]|uniref:hypothetical protein n=1 Tax=Gluconacetobacter diazotrophicus TaxID=33996 RepID=UPI001C94E938
IIWSCVNRAFFIVCLQWTDLTSMRGHFRGQGQWTSGGLRLTVDTSDIGLLATQDWVSGNYVSESQYTSDFGGTTTTCINLPYGVRIQAWSFYLTTSGYTAQVNFPVAFSAGPSAILVESSAGDMDTWTTNWSSTGFTINVPDRSPNTNGNISVLAVGPK